MSSENSELGYNRSQGKPPGRRAVIRGTIVIVLPVFVLLLIAAALITVVDENARMSSFRSEQQHSLWIQALDLDRDIRGVSSDLMVLANQNEIRSFWDQEDEMSVTVLAALNTEYLDVSIYRGLYDQIRLLDDNGMEVVRINYNAGQPAAVTPEGLQNKKSRYYFTDSFSLNRGEVFVSPLDLNIEHGQVEEPPKPMMRFATPVFDVQDNKRGVVILNYLAAGLLDRYRTRYDPAFGSQAMLINADGYWLHGPNPSDEWGFMYEARRNRTFGADFPDAWKTINSEEVGQFETAAGLFTFRTVYPILEGQKASTGPGRIPLPHERHMEANDFYWKAVSFVPAKALYGSRFERLQVVAVILFVLLLLVFFVAWRIAGAGVLRRQAEEALQNSETRLEALSKASFEAIFLSEKGRCIDQNETAEQMFGYTHAESIGKRGAEWIVPEDRERVKKYMRADREQPCETTGLRKDGTTFPCEIQARSTHGGANSILITALRDVTDRKRSEEKNQVLERQVQHAQKLESLGVLAGGIAHDFNNLLMAILGNAELARDGLSPMSPALANIRKIEEVSKRAADLANQMLAYSGKGRFVVEPIDAAALIGEMMHLLEVAISKKIILKYDFTKNLPAFDGDATQIRQIIMNLITNASEAIGEESGVVTLAAGTMECDRYFLDEDNAALSTPLGEPIPEGIYTYFEVSDTGCGMSPETAERIFDPFFTTKFTGRGLGMSAVLGIVRGHYGVIKISSEVGGGTTFRILFPANADSLVGNGSASNLENTETEWWGSGTVLLADDEEAVRAVGKQMLERLGFDVVTAANGRQAVELFRGHADEIDWVLLDLSMPVLDGKEALHEIRSIRPGVSVILSSGYNESEAVQQMTDDGPAGFIQKPFTTNELKDKLGEILNDPGGEN